MAGGFIIQWGVQYGLTDTGKDESVIVRFPKAFPNTCCVVLACGNCDHVASGAGVIYTKKSDRYSFKITLDSVDKVWRMDAFWVAFGC